MTSFKEKLSGGYYAVDYQLDARIDNLNTLKEWIRTDQPRYTGWPPFVWIDRDGFRPRVTGQNTLSCTIIDEGRISRKHYERWRASTDGIFSVIRAHDTDCLEEYQNAIGLVLPVWRIAELMLHASRMASRFEAGKVEFTARFTGLEGRELISAGSNRLLSPGHVTGAPDYQQTVLLDAATIDDGVAAYADELLRPFYRLFELELPEALVEEEIGKMRASRF